MERNYKILLGAALIVTILLFLYDIYVGGMAFIIFIALLMSVWIMEDSRMHPDVYAMLKNGAKAIELKNRGNAAAFAIHVAIIPLDIEFDVPLLKEDEKYLYAFEKMINEVKVAVSFENENKERFSKTYLLSATGKSDEDLLKPAFPLFKWRKEDD
ncbi:MAG TPA: hypothetical protein PLK36_06950 [Methanoregulaceae archaeon]|nr:hypothetical protein [Methanoregulaceae archaeon]HQN89797.1 hypothetical protein [Methanoregulaceae archaeon]HQP82502.1 hypothetical protein [Methanoregulaceae archaeon]